MPYPWLFLCGLILSTFGFILLGALGQRYATIAFGALLIAVYTMLGASLYPSWYLQTLLLLCGAVWYNLVALLVYLLFPSRPLQSRLALCYLQLANLLQLKSALFDADEEGDFAPQMLAVAAADSKLIKVLSQTKYSLLARLRSGRNHHATQQLLHNYFIIKDIHERISSIHYHYPTLSKELHHSDLLFRIQRLLQLYSDICRQMAATLSAKAQFQPTTAIARTLHYLYLGLERWQSNATVALDLAEALNHLLKNLQAVDRQFNTLAASPSLLTKQQQDHRLSDDEAHGMIDIWQRICSHLTVNSSLFRHAIRMALVLATGFLLIHFLSLTYGYWIMLTSLLVCQPNYIATRQRLIRRVIGTVTGVLLAVPVLYFVPAIEGQLLLIIISGTLFCILRYRQYAQATMFITLMILLCFNLSGEGYQLTASAF